MTKRPNTIMLCVAANLAIAVYATAQSYELVWRTVDSGGGMSSIGSGFELSGTIGQPDAGSPSASLSGGGFELVSGFWPGIGLNCLVFAPADFNRDCDVDQDDYGEFQSCSTGADLGPVTPGCVDMDFDSDDDVDQSDFGVFQRCLSGANVPGDPNCAGS